MRPASYDGGVSATFGNDVAAICTGEKNAGGTLVSAIAFAFVASRRRSGVAGVFDPAPVPESAQEVVTFEEQVEAEAAPDAEGPGPASPATR